MVEERNSGPPAKGGPRRQDNPRAPTVWKRVQRLREDLARLGDIERLAGDTLFGTELHRLHLFGLINDIEISAGLLIAEVWGAYDTKVLGRTRSVASPAYMVGGGGGGLAEERMESAYREKLTRKIKAIRKRWEDVQDALFDDQVRAAVERVCVDNQPITEAEVPYLRAGLRLAAEKLGVIREARRTDLEAIAITPKLGRIARRNRRGPRPQRDPRQRRELAWLRLARQLRPDLDDKALREMFERERAVEDRDRFRGRK